MAQHKRKRARIIFVYGYYGRRNCGDDAMLYAFLARQAREDSDDHFAILTGEDNPVLPAGIAHRVGFVRPNGWEVLRRALKAQAFVIVGGTHLAEHGHWARSAITIGRILALVSLLKLLRKREFFLGVGLGPFRSRLFVIAAKLICMQLDGISVRDGTSLRTLRALGTRIPAVLGFDFAAVLSPAAPTKGEACERFWPTLGISITPSRSIYFRDFEGDLRFVRTLAEGVNRWMNNHADWKVRLFVFHGRSAWTKNDDSRITQHLFECLRFPERVETIEYAPDPTIMLAAMSECSALVGMKLHALLYAFVSQIPFIVIPYHPKCVALADEVGLPALARLAIEDLNPITIEERLDLVTGPSPPRASLPLADAKRRAELGLSLLQGLYKK